MSGFLYIPKLSTIMANFDYSRVNTVSGEITSPSDNITIGPISLIFSAKASTTSPKGIGQVEFYVYYDGTWHSAGIDGNYPYEVAWQIPAQLKSQQLKFGINVVDNDNMYVYFAGGVHKVNFVKILSHSRIVENWIPTRAYINQRSLEPGGDLKCSAACMSMLLAMNGLLSIDYMSMRKKANEMYPRVLNAEGDVLC